MKRKQLRGGNSSIMRRGVLYGASSSNCLRMVLLRDKVSQQAEPDERSKRVFKIGHLNEELFERDYLSDVEDVEKEKEVCIEISDKVDFIGHIDMATPGLLYELKSCTSDNTYRKVFIQNSYKKENLIQLATYMLMSETVNGFLCYTSYTDKLQYKTLDKHDFDAITALAEESERETRFIRVTFTDEGKVFADNADSGIMVQDILEFQNAAINVLENEIVYPDRPEPFNSNERYTACYSCPLNKVCTQWEEKRWPTERFVRECKKALNINEE